MQTFLPYSDFVKSAMALDRLRLGKQRVEVKQILGALRSGGGWVRHPAVRMWRGYENALMSYGNAVICEWQDRGYQNNIPFWQPTGVIELPIWLGDERFHSAHRAALLFKDPEWYGQWGWEEQPAINYYWPI